MKQSLLWDYYQNEAPELFAQSGARLRCLAHTIKSGGKVLNIGVGTGIFEEIASHMGFDIHSLDPNEATITMLRQRFHMGEKAQVGYCQRIPFQENSFDSVVISEVIEHLSPEETEQTLKEVARVLVPDGRIAGTVPACENLKEQLVICPHCGGHFHRWGHLQSFDTNKITALLSPYYQIKKVYQRPFHDWPRMNWKGKIICFIKILFYYLGIHGSNENIVFTAAKPRG
jgi:SAM-dependent methyltransferase